MPILILVFLLIDFLSIGFLFIDYKLWHNWLEYRNTAADDYAQRCLYGAIALLAYCAFGKQLIILLLSKRRKNEDEPAMIDPKKFITVKRPDGTELFVEEVGNPAGQPIIFVHGWNAT